MSYSIRRYHQGDAPSRQVRGLGRLTLAEAQAHCARADTHAPAVCDRRDGGCGYREPNVSKIAGPCPNCGRYGMSRAWFEQRARTTNRHRSMFANWSTGVRARGPDSS